MSESTPLPERDSPWLAKFRLIRDEVKHEQDVLAGRLSSYITSQSFLISAYAVSMNNVGDHWSRAYRIAFPIVLGGVGFLLSVRAQPGIADAAKIINSWHDRQDDLLQAHPELDTYQPLARDKMSRVRDRDQWFAQAAAYIFGAAWILLVAISVFFNATA